MTRLDHALRLAEAGFYVFPLKPGGKTPAHKGWQQEATRDPETIKGWFDRQDFNIGVYTGRFGDGEALLVIDCDNKNGKRGNDELIRLELEGLDLPAGRETLTPADGRHLFFRVGEAVRQGADVIARGLDVRSRGGYVVGPGSRTKDGEYVEVPGGVPLAPAWLVGRCGRGRPPRERGDTRPPAVVDAGRAFQRAAAYLRDEAPLAVEGEAGDETTYKVACRLKDFGLPGPDAAALMAEHWNERCSPPWEMLDLCAKVENAYAYGREPPGTAAPEADFQPVTKDVPCTPEADPKLHPYDEINKDFAYCIAGDGDHILWETTDEHGRDSLKHLSIGTFHRRFAARKITVGKKASPVTEEWMQWDGRRSYDGLVFMPEMEAPPRFYNLWTGFAVAPWPEGKPVPPEAQGALDAFLEHARENICRGSAALFDWLIGYFAHLVQRPWEKPLVALVFKGAKGVGKSALVERVGALLGSHFTITAARRYLVGNFNGHLENCLLLCFEEAFWSGDKQAEGTLKDLITGTTHVIEHKGKESYKVDNRTRIAVIGNEEWIVPASHDERRFAVFDVGESRKQDRAFFQQMREGMEVGGYALLLRYLQGRDLSLVDVNAAPFTAALLDQKHASLAPAHEWWLESLTEGRLVGADFEGGWGGDVECDRLRAAFRRWAKDRNIKGRFPTERSIGRDLKKVGIDHTRARVGGGLGYVYRVPELAEARAKWDGFIGHAVEWPD